MEGFKSLYSTHDNITIQLLHLGKAERLHHQLLPQALSWISNRRDSSRDPISRKSSSSIARQIPHRPLQRADFSDLRHMDSTSTRSRFVGFYTGWTQADLDGFGVSEHTGTGWAALLNPAQRLSVPHTTPATPGYRFHAEKFGILRDGEGSACHRQAPRWQPESL